MRHYLRRSLQITLLSLSLGGCAGFGDRVAAPGACLWGAGGAGDAAQLLAYAQRLRTLSSDDLQRERDAAARGLVQKKTAADRLRMALLLTGPDPRFRDDARAAALLQEVVKGKGGGSPALKNLAALLLQVAEERLRQEERCQTLADKAKEEQKRADALQQKLDALKAIEKNIINRDPIPPLPVK